MDARRGGLIRVIPRGTVNERVGKNDLCSLAASLARGHGASMGKEAVWSDSGRVGEVVAEAGGRESGLSEQPAMASERAFEYPGLG